MSRYFTEKSDKISVDMFIVHVLLRNGSQQAKMLYTMVTTNHFDASAAYLLHWDLVLKN